MKKRTKITLRTKIYLTIVALLALTGVFYAQFPPAHPVPFASGIPLPTGVAAAPDLLLVSEYCSENIDTVACDGTHTLFATMPGFGSCQEKYLTIAPSQSAMAAVPFTPRDVFVTEFTVPEGPAVHKIHEGTVSLFATLPGCGSSDHNGITFDHFSTFGYDMIVTCQEGDVFRVDGNGNATFIANVFACAPACGPLTDGEVEGPAVVPPGFGPHGGEIWVADEGNSAVHAIKNNNNGTYTVTQNILSHVAAESVNVIPNPPCAFCDSPPSAFFQAEQQLGQFVWRYPLTDFTLPPPGLGGNVLLTSESGVEGADTSLVTFDGTNYVQSSFGPRPPGTDEGSSMVDCDVPTATPTPTATATSTPTATATATATFTPTATATATATATSTPTATATSTPTATATSTPTPTPTPAGGCQFSTSSANNFNDFAINGGNYIWFTSVLKAQNLPSNAAVTITFTNQTITSPNFGPLSVPDGTVTFDPTVTFATTTFDAFGRSTTIVPSNPTLKGNTFFSALSFLVPANLPGSIRPVTWSGTISTATPGVKVTWQWAAAVYPNAHFSANPSTLGVKPVDDKVQNPYLNADHAGTPENFKTFTLPGATGGGATNYTGSLGSSKTVGPCQP